VIRVSQGRKEKAKQTMVSPKPMGECYIGKRDFLILFRPYFATKTYPRKPAGIGPTTERKTQKI